MILKKISRSIWHRDIISAYGGGIVSVYFSPDYFFRNVNKMAAWTPDNKKKEKFIVNNQQLLLDMK
jgi:hypothetical protein